MSDDTYQRLRESIDKYSVGMAKTETGVEIRVLKKLFTEDEAKMYINLTDNLQSAEEIGKQIGKDPKEVEALLKRMTLKGHTFPRFPKKEGEPFYYAAAPFIHGILEHQLGRFDKELAELLEEYWQAGAVSRQVPGLRTIPVQTAIDQSLSKVIATYDDAKAIIHKKDRIAVAKCVCNEWQEARGMNCSQPKEVCFLFDFYGQYYVDKGIGRWVTPEEAQTILGECENAGLVAQFSNSENPEALCNCCPNCCGALRLLKGAPQAALLAPSNHVVQINPELCSSCETCVDRCPLDAIAMGKLAAQINVEKCIGCGLCVATCPEEALKLTLKPEQQRFKPPEEGIFMKSTKEIEAGIAP
jgi:Na+-translocating ferredoxin:NAD+ oxidoreductase subunit B